jgi:regulator of sigma E protease
VHYLAQAGYFVALLGALVLIHELGHFFAARLCGVKVLRFSVGFGRRLVGWQRPGGTDYCLSAFPLGGYVQLLGEDPRDQITAADRGRALHERPLAQRFLIVLAGPAANVLAPLFIYFAVFAAQRTLPAAVCGQVFPGQPAYGLLQPGDRVLAVDGEPVRAWRDFERAIAGRPGATVSVTVRRGNLPLTLAVRVAERPRAAGSQERPAGMVGISPRWPLAQVAVLDPGSPAARAGLRTFDLITTVNAEPVTTFSDLERAFQRSRGEPLRLTWLRPQALALDFADLARLEPQSALVALEPGGRKSAGALGLTSAELVTRAVEPGSPLANAGLSAGDELVALDGAPIGSWELLEETLAAAPERAHLLSWRVAGSSPTLTRSATFQPRLDPVRDEFRQRHRQLVHGALGRPLYQLDPPVLIEHRLTLAARRAAERTFGIAADMLRAMGALLLHRIPHDTVGGPLLVLQIAGVAAERGGDFFLAMLALVSLNIGLLNLLPIPALDGGHLVFFLVEAARRRPVSPRVRLTLHRVGLVVIAGLVVLAVKNDLVRYLFD